jgi:hypothetical protein
LGRTFIKQLSDPLHAQSPHFIGHGDSRESVERVLRKAEAARTDILAVLAVDVSPERAHCYVVADEASWAKFRRKADLREDGMAFHVGEDIFVRPEAGRYEEVTQDIPHELVHFYLREGYGDSLPLLIEEGTAMQLGWQVTEAMYAFHGRRVEQHWEPLGQAGDGPDLAAVMRLKRYPEDPAQATLFYRLGEAWISAVRELLDDAAFADYIREVSVGNENAWKTALIGPTGMSEEEFEAMVDRVEAAARGRK